ncbi:MAG: DUF6249 domain-containing protein [Nevskia sp.]|nr:DUF6249 domain-containing protein [Nevskia sp.]
MLPILDVDVAAESLAKLGIAHDSANGVAYMGELIGLVAVVLLCGLPIMITIAVLRHRTNRQKLLNDLILKLAEKGQPIPPQLFGERAVPEKTDLRRGIRWMMAGLGIAIFGVFDGDSDIIGIGFIPAMIGLGFIIAAHLERKQKEGEQ